MTIKEFNKRIEEEYLMGKKALVIHEFQSTASSKHEYDPETYVFCEIITVNNNKRHVIRISASRFKDGQIPTFIIIDAIQVIFRSPSHPNIYKQEIAQKNIFHGYMTDDGKDSTFSFPLLLGILNNVEGFFR